MTKDETQDNPVAPAYPRVTHFRFQARVFQAPGAHFVLMAEGAGQPKKPMFGVAMGEGHAMISLRHLRDNFGIPAGSLDDHLIERAEAGLEYVPDIKPGDAIPNELLDGTASWTVGRKHKRIARERIQAQLLSLVTDKPVDATDREALTALMNAPATIKLLRDAFRKAAVKLGLKAEESEQVVDRIETLARELCYIEALRDRAGEVLRIRQMLPKLIKAYTNDQRMVDEINRCELLMKSGWGELKTQFDAADAKIADVVGALQTIDAVIDAIRQARDTIHFVLMQWDPVIARWQPLTPGKSQPIEKALQALYRLLASRFPTGKSIIGGRRG